MTQDDDKPPSDATAVGSTEHDKDTLRPPAVPRPSEVHPMNAVSGTPPPVEVFLEDTPTKLMMSEEISEVLAEEREKKRQRTLSGAKPASSAPSAPPSELPFSLGRPSSRAPLRGLGSERALDGRRPKDAAPSAAPRPNTLLRPSQAVVADEPPLLCVSSEQLEERGLTQSFVERAESLELQASAQREAAKKARLLAVASELRAMTGQVAHARSLAERAAKLGNHLGQRQARQLAQLQGDTKSVSNYLAAELHTAPSPATRVHAAITHAEFERVQRKDPLAAGRSLDQAQRNAPTDPRPGLLKLARQLGSGAKPPSFKWGDAESLAPLASATAALSQLRGDARVKPSPSSAPVAVLLDAQRALARRDRQGAAAALTQLRDQPGFQRAVPWLAAALLAPLATTRRKAVELLTSLLDERNTRTIRRALAARALELGDTDSARLALQGDTDQEPADRAFSPADHLAIGALCGTGAERLLDALTAAESQDDLRPLAHAAAFSSEQPNHAPELVSGLTQAISVAHQLSVEPATALTPKTEELEADPTSESLPVHPLLRALALEHASESSNARRVADLILTLSSGAAAEQSDGFGYAAALTLEHASETGMALKRYASVVKQPQYGEAALRALLDLSDPERAPKLIEEFAEHTDEREKRALLLAEAALLAPDTEERDRLSLEACAAAPDNVLVEALIQRLATGSERDGVLAAEPHTRASGEQAQAEHSPLEKERAALLARQAGNSDSEYERALALVRQVYGNMSPDSTATLLNHAWDIWPKDLGLLDMRELCTELPMEVGARARETLAATMAQSSTQNALRLEAALLYELAGLGSKAARVAELCANEEPLAALCFSRTAPGTEFAGKLRQRVADQVQKANTAEERAEWSVTSARLASDAGDWPGERQAIEDAVRLNPNHLEALLAAETLAFRDGDLGRIADIETKLAEVLPASELDAHAQFAARFDQLENGWAAGYATLQLCDKGDQTALDVSRRLASLARRADNDELYYQMLTNLLRGSQRAPDQAVLLLRCAEAALRLGKTGTALTHLDDAVQLAPQYVSALALRAEVLSEQQFFAAAAEAYERLAQAATSNLVRGQSYKLAARRLLQETRAANNGETVEPGPPAASLELALRVNEQATAVAASHRPADPTRVRLNLERALEAAPNDPEVFEMLVQMYTAQGLDAQLAELFNRRLEASEGDSRLRLELRWSRAWVELGAPERAREMVEQVLKRSPEDEQALTQLVELTGEDAATKEQTLLQLVRVTSSARQQSQAYKQLGSFYQHTDPQPARAVRCYQEALKRDPSDSEAFASLVEVLLQQGALSDADTAVATFAQQVHTERDKLAVELAQAQVEGHRDPAQAELRFRDLLQRWPMDESVLTSLVLLFQRTNNVQKLQALTDELRRDASKQLPNGELLGKCLASLTQLAKLTADTSSRALILALSNLFHGQASSLDARGSRAMSRGLDALLAPAPLRGALRSLLSHTTLAMERAFPLNLEDMQAARLQDPRVRASFDMKAKAMGLNTPELHIVRKLPYACFVTQEPARIIVGSSWVELSSPSALDFVAWRALKILQTRLGPIAHLSDDGLLSHMEALLSAYVDTHGALAEPSKVESLRKRLHPHLPKEPELIELAQEALHDLCESELELRDAIALWTNRCALLAIGDPRAAVNAVALLHGELPPAHSGAPAATLEKVPQTRHIVASLLDAEFTAAHRSITPST